MKAKELEGRWALKVRKGEIDGIFYEFPVKLLKVTDTHITYRRGDQTRIYPISTYTPKGEWVPAKETLGEHFFKELIPKEDWEKEFGEYRYVSDEIIEKEKGREWWEEFTKSDYDIIDDFKKFKKLGASLLTLRELFQEIREPNKNWWDRFESPDETFPKVELKKAKGLPTFKLKDLYSKEMKEALDSDSRVQAINKMIEALDEGELDSDKLLKLVLEAAKEMAETLDSWEDN